MTSWRVVRWKGFIKTFLNVDGLDVFAVLDVVDVVDIDVADVVDAAVVDVDIVHGNVVNFIHVVDVSNVSNVVSVTDVVLDTGFVMSSSLKYLLLQFIFSYFKKFEKLIFPRNI